VVAWHNGKYTTADLKPAHDRFSRFCKVQSSDIILGFGRWLSLRTKFEFLVQTLALKVKSLVLTLLTSLAQDSL